MLTEIKIKQLKPEEKRKRYFDGHGLYLEVHPNGKRYWRLKYRFDGKEKQLSIGVYPAISLKQARSARGSALDLLAEGKDPSVEKKKKSPLAMTIDAGPTFQKIAHNWLELNKEKWAHSHYRTVIQRLEGNVFPYIGNRSIAELAPVDILDTIKIMEARGVRESAHKTMSICSQVFRYAVASCIIESDPTRDLRGALAPVIRGNFAAITTPKEAAALMRAISDYAGAAITQYALFMHAYTFCRPGEIRQAEWSEIDFDEAMWAIPAEKMKMKREHIVPLSKQSIGILKNVHLISGRGRYIFPSQRTADRPMSSNTVNAALRRLGYMLIAGAFCLHTD
ncbi:tyrosine-type recombinase/integrase [Oleidesulfovibrio sp.]|uniref:tyrosine-type recombinase/integrase n=1 Tax=Oleidesulfovibrio sp. TaxID=2909707 RepID=UPI003A895BB4